MVDMAFVKVNCFWIIRDIEPRAGDTRQHLEEKAAEMVRRIQETRGVIYKVLMALHRSPAYRSTTMNELRGCKYRLDRTFPGNKTSWRAKFQRLVGVDEGR